MILPQSYSKMFIDQELAQIRIKPLDQKTALSILTAIPVRATDRMAKPQDLTSRLFANLNYIAFRIVPITSTESSGFPLGFWRFN